MKVSGFTFVRNAVQFDYPIVEAITSILPICDEMIVLVGNCDDGTLDLIAGIPSDKIKIIPSTWDESLRSGGRVLAVETNKAFKEIAPDADWAFYIQADEIVHEKFLPVIQKAMLDYKDDKKVEGLVFNYLHFYGSYDYVADAYRWYRREVRVIRNDPGITSYRDAQGFRRIPKEKLRCKLVDASIYHYGWVREPGAMQGKQRNFNYYYFDDRWIEANVGQAAAFDYSGIDSLRKFEGTHPQVMQKRIASMNWKFDHELSHNSFKLKDRFKRFVERWTGWRIGEFRNYKII